ncbi:MAG: FAD-binding oxidoreductase [Zetaproteobacteria bacterium]|nr:FAD-binding oxidoreductase [Zetaproteobacteria bacterium]
MNQMQGCREAVVLGRGIFGLSVAYALLGLGCRVLVLGKNEPAKSASRAAVGVSCQKGLKFARSQAFQRKLVGQQATHSLAQELGVELYSPLWEPYDSVVDFAARCRRAYQSAPKGLYAVHAAPQFPAFPFRAAPPPMGALCYQDDYSYDPISFLTRLEQAILQRGGKIVSVEAALVPQQEGVQVVAEGFKSSSEAAVVLATGAQTPKLLQTVVPKLPKTQFSWGGTFCLPRVVTEEPPFAWRSKQVSCNVLSHEVRFGSYSLANNQPYLATAMYEGLCNLWQNHLSLSFEKALLVSGCRLAFRTRYPLCDQVPGQKNLWVFAGAYKSGYDLGPLLGRSLALEIFSAHKPQSLRPFAWGEQMS